MFGGSTSSLGKNESDDTSKPDDKSPSPEPNPTAAATTTTTTTTTTATTTSSGSPPASKPTDQAASGEKRSGNGRLPTRQDTGGSSDKKRRSSGVSGKASSFLASAKNSLSFSQGSKGSISEESDQAPNAKLAKQDTGMGTPHNNAAGESIPGPRSTFRVGVWEDKNRKCRRTMEDTHAFLYNFLAAPTAEVSTKDDNQGESGGGEVAETDDGYFAIFDGHAGTFAADWCGKKVHLILEEAVRKNPNLPIPELLDQTFTSVDSQLEKLPLKNSGCTAAIAVLRWEDRPSNAQGTPGLPPTSLSFAATAPLRNADSRPADSAATKTDPAGSPEPAGGRIRSGMTRNRMLYTANVGDARIILCRSGKALRLSYDHKGSDENEGRRIANAGGLILNNRVNGVLAVTRALGDAYMKDLVTGHPYTTETVVQPDNDEFLIIACDGLWDVCSDQEAVDLVREIDDPVEASKLLVDHALNRFSTDNLSCMIVRLDGEKHAEALGAVGDGTSEKPGEEKEGDFKPTALGSTVEVEEEGEGEQKEKNEEEKKEQNEAEKAAGAKGTEVHDKAK